MLRRVGLVFVLIACMALAVACSKNGGEKNGTDSITTNPQDSITPTSAPTLTPTLTPTPTQAPTQAPDLATMTARSRELHEAIRPQITANPVGTGLELSAQDKIDYDYGLKRTNGIKINKLNRLTGLPTDEYFDDVLVSISGLKNEEVSQKINDRVKTILDTMADPAYFPDVRGAMSLIREKGIPKKSVGSSAEDAGHGILTVDVWCDCYWEIVYPDPQTDEENDRQWAAINDWCAQGTGYSVDVEDYLDDGRILRRFVIFDRIQLNFDLATGEELSMSDLFPEGFDYLEYLNTEIAARSQYCFWFHHVDDYSQYRDHGYDMFYHSYDETLEIDGGQRLEDITGDEQFTLYSDMLVLYPGNGRKETMYIPVPNMIADRGRGEKLCIDDGECSVECLADYEFCDYGMDDPHGRKIGEFRTRLDGTHEVTVHVFGAEDKCSCKEALNMRDLDDVIGADFPDERIIELAKQCIASWGNCRYPKQDCYIYLTYVYVYPNGYYRAEWLIAQYDGDEDEYIEYSYYGYYDHVVVWIKDGKQIPETDLLDVSYEELMTEIIAGLRYIGEPIADREQAAASAKALMPYFIGFDWGIARTFDHWDWNDYLFRWKDGGEIHDGMPNYYQYDDNDYNEPRPEELNEILPELIWKNYDFSRWIDWSDPYLVVRHLKIYEGVDFPKG